MEIVEDTGSAAYLRLADELLTRGHVVAPRGLATRELIDVTLILVDPDQAHVLGTTRRPNLKIAATEALHLVGGISSLAQLDLASGGRFNRFADEGRLRGAYGPRAHAQLLAVEARLRRDPDTRQAVVTLWRGDELPSDSRDTPCTVSLQFLLRDGLLNLRVSMRSNDLWLGVPYDFMTFSCLHRTMAVALDVNPGTYVHTVGSMHVYETDVPRLRGVVNDGKGHVPSTPLVSSGIPIPPPWNTFTASDFAARAAYARRICLREPGDSFFFSLASVTSGVPFLLSNVPALPRSSFVCNCNYVIPLDANCEECDAGEAVDSPEVVSLAPGRRVVRPPELGSLPRLTSVEES